MSSIEDEIKQDIANNKVLIYGKGTKEAPQCGFTVETIQFFQKYGYPFEVINGTFQCLSPIPVHHVGHGPITGKDMGLIV